MRILLYREGLHIFISAGLTLIICLVAGITFSCFPCLLGACLAGLFLLFTVLAFRNPNRHSPVDDTILLSPADGRIVDIVNLDFCVFFDGPAQLISIFLSPLDVHVNRSPATGRIILKSYRKGRFYPAFRKKSSDLNEHTIIGIENLFGKIYFKQIAGMVFRRIVCHLKENDYVSAGEAFGMIKFGSRVDIFVSPKVRIVVSKGGRVRAGLSIIGEYRDKKQ